jgi:hypothetical protein
MRAGQIGTRQVRAPRVTCPPAAGIVTLSFFKQLFIIESIIRQLNSVHKRPGLKREMTGGFFFF